MVEKKEINYDELFVRAMQNSRRHFINYHDATHTIRNHSIATNSWTDHLREHGITWDFMDRFYYEDEQQLGFFILKWS